jgi:hypothetical protein
MRGERIEYWVGEFCDAVGKSAKHNCQSHIIHEIRCLYNEAQKEVLQERDKYKEALEKIAQGPRSIDWSYSGYIELTAGEVFQNIATEALKNETK